VVVSEVMKVCEVVVSEVMKACEVVVSEVMKVCEVVMVPEVMKVIHRVGGQRHRRGKHRPYDNASNSHFAEHDNPSGCPPRAK
jgi:HJR/Mrr/RecB family endonuclease